MPLNPQFRRGLCQTDLLLMSKPGLYGMRWKERKVRKSMPHEARRKNWLTRKPREPIVEYVQRTKKIFAWGARCLRDKNSNTAKSRWGSKDQTARSTRNRRIRGAETQRRKAQSQRCKAHLVGAWYGTKSPYQRINGMPDEQSIENEILSKGLVAPRLTPEQIDRTVIATEYHVFGGLLTVCVLTLRNGFMVTGESAPASKANFDEELGQKIAYDNARGKIWALEGYLLRTRISNGTN